MKGLFLKEIKKYRYLLNYLGKRNNYFNRNVCAKGILNFNCCLYCVCIILFYNYVYLSY